MGLNRRQERAYLDTVDIWLPDNAVTLGGRGQARNRQWSDPNAPDATGVPCQRIPSKELDSPTVTGRQNYDIALTIDVFHFTSDTVVQDQALIRLTTTGHPDNGRYFVVKGEATDVVARGRRRGNFRELFANPVAKPEGYP